MGFGFGGASTELTLVIRGDGSVAVKELRKVNQGVAKVSKRTADWGRTAKRAGRVAAIAIAAVGLAYGKALSSAAAFDKEFTKILTLFRGAPKDILALRKELLLMDSSIPPVQRATAAYEIMSAGFRNAADSQEVFQVAMEGAIGGSADLQEVTLALTKTMKAYDQGADGARNTMDILNGAIVAGQTRMGALAGSYGRVAKIAATLGITQKELAATVGATTLALGNTETAVTSFLGIMNAALKPSEELKNLMGENTIASMGWEKWLIKIFEAGELNAQMLGKLIPNVRALPGFLTIAADGAKEYNKALDLVNDTSGITRENFEKMEKTFAEQWALMKANIKIIEVLIGTGGAEGGGLVGINAALRDFIDYLNAHETELESLARLFGDIAEAATWAGRQILALAELMDRIRLGGPAQPPPAMVEAARREGRIQALRQPGGAPDFRQTIDALMPSGPLFDAPSVPSIFGDPGLAGLPAAFKEQFGLAPAQMSTEFEQLFASVQKVTGAIEFDKDGFVKDQWAGLFDIVDELGPEMSAAKRAAEGFREGMEAQLETLARTNPAMKDYVDILLEAFIPWQRGREEAKKWADVVARAEQAPIEPVRRYAQAVIDLSEAMASGTLSGEDIAKAQRGINFAVEQGIELIEAQTIATQALQAAEERRISFLLQQQQGTGLPRIAASLLEGGEEGPGIFIPSGTLQFPPAAGVGTAFGMAGAAELAKIPAEFLEGMDEGIAIVEGDLELLAEDWKETMGIMGEDTERLAIQLERSIARAFATMIVDGEFSWKSLMDTMLKMWIETQLQMLIQGGTNASAGGITAGGIGSVAGAIVGGPIGAIVGGFLGGLFDNPVNDAMARTEGARFTRFFGEGIEQEQMRSSGGASVRGDEGQTINNNQVYNISTVPQDPRETARELTRQTERAAW